MKPYIYSFIITTVFTAALQAQETIDTVQFRAVYTFAYKTRPELPQFNRRDVVFLDIGERVTKFYSRYTQMRDSVKKEGLKNNLQPMEIQDMRRGIPMGTDPVYYQRYDKKKTEVSTVTVFNGYMYEEPMALPEWTLHEDTMMVLGYLCKRATTHYFGRDWEVYYAPEIQLSRGPWKLWGLPGLITRATDSDNYFLFEMTNFERSSRQAQPIVYIHRKMGPKGDYKGKEYKVISKKTYIQYEKAYHEDLRAFGDFETGHKSFTPDGSSPPVLKEDYIPLEK